MRKIIHIDMDAFYASIEQRDNPQYRGKPLAVGYSGERGVVAAASYEARRYGIHSAMSSKIARLRCPHIIFVPARFDVYHGVSQQIMDIFLDYTDLVEPLSLDEAYLDVTTNKKRMPSATIIAEEIKRRIKETTGLTASAGVSVNKFLAKIASDYKKPDGLFVITEKAAEPFVEALKIERFFGIGKVTAEKMHGFGIYTGADLKRFSEAFLVKYFGKAGHTFYWNARAIDDREVTPNRIRKSVGSETTLLIDLEERDEISEVLDEVTGEVWRRISKTEFYGRTVTLKIKYDNFEQTTRSKTLPGFVEDFTTLRSAADELLNNIELSGKRVRLVGLSVGNIQDIEPPTVYQLELEFPPE